MMTALRILTILFATALAILSAGNCYGETAKEEIAVIKGEHITQIFASVCGEKNFADYQAWVLKNHFGLRQFDSPKFQISKNEIKDDDLLFSVKINEQNKWQATLRDQKFIGEDPCEVAMAYLNSRSAKRLTDLLGTLKKKKLQIALAALLPEAQAEKLVNEATTTNWLLGALATASITDGAFVENLVGQRSLPNSYFLAATFHSMKIANQTEATANLESALNQKYEILCSRNRSKIYGADLHLIVKKGYKPNRIGFEDNRTGKPLKNESQILAKGKLYDHLVEFGQTCNQDGDTERIYAELRSEREQLNTRIANSRDKIYREISSDK